MALIFSPTHCVTVGSPGQISQSAGAQFAH
jgi:hypothetical protein